MAEQNSYIDFEQKVLPHLDAAYNLARWLTRNKEESEDIVQEAYLRAFRYFGGFRGGDSRAWLLKIVRNTYYTRLTQRQANQATVEFEEETCGSDVESLNPEQLLMKNDSGDLVRRALEKLPPNFREVIILRELEGMSYKEISMVTGIPQGTVMSSLFRARGQLRRGLTGLMSQSSALVPRPAATVNN